MLHPKVTPAQLGTHRLARTAPRPLALAPYHSLSPLAVQISGRGFTPVATHRPKRTPWLDGFVEGVPYPYLTDPYEAAAALTTQEVRSRSDRWDRRVD